MAKNANANAPKANDTTGAETITNTTAAPKAIVISSTKADTKAEKARAVFNDCYKDGADKAPQRKDIIARLQAEAGLTPAGAATYLQNMKKQVGLVKSTKPEAPAAETK